MKRRDFLRTVVAGAALAGVVPKQAVGASARKASSKEGKSAAGKHIFCIDAYSHFTSMASVELMERLSGTPNPMRAQFEHNRVVFDPTARIQAMDEARVDAHVLVPAPFIEGTPSVYEDPKKALQAAQATNDGLAEVVSKYPKRFAGVALLPTTNADVMLGELERAVKKLHFVGGVFVVSPTAKPPDHADYMQLYDKAAALDVPLWIHPSRPATYPDYVMENRSKDGIWMMLGWPIDSSIAMCRIAFSGVFDRHPNLRIIIHHRGGLIPSWWSRIDGILHVNAKFMQPPNISQPYVKHFKKFYCDTASSGHEPEILKVAYDFFGPDHVLFGTDSPNDGNRGLTMTEDARYDVDHMGLSDAGKKKVFSENLLGIIPPASAAALKA
jgi:uncharacterized protein